jgi:hypothetical protein
MDPSETGPEIPTDPVAPSSREPFGRAATRMAQACAMVAVVSLGVATLSFFPHPRRVPPAPAAPEPVRMAPAAPATAPVALAPPLRPRIAPPPVRHRLAAEVRSQRAVQAPIAVVAARRSPAACRAPHVAADRLVCSEPALATLDRRMRAAYARAIAAGADRLEIDRSQARWHGARDRATGAGQLAQLYARRIADLEAAARNPRRPGPFGGLT